MGAAKFHAAAEQAGVGDVMCPPQTGPSVINGDGVLFCLDIFPFLFP